MFRGSGVISSMTTIKRKDCNWKLLFLLLVVATLYLTYLALNTRVTLGVPYFTTKVTLHVPYLTVEEKIKRTMILEELSAQLERNFSAVQNQPCSNTTALYCGHSDSCGLGCQLHHRIACMILSYSFNMPMIHNDKRGWVFQDPWKKYFKKIGSNCTISSVAKVINLDWTRLKCTKSFNICLKKGIPMHKEFAQMLDQNHSDPFLWLLGRFATFVFQPNDEALEHIAKFKESLGILPRDLHGSPLIGMHVRRTDKLIRESKVRLNATDFMDAAIAFRNDNLIDAKKQITIFIASEDNDVINEFRSNYESPSWKFVTGCIQTFNDTHSRRSQLFEIIRDVQVLVDSDYVICTHSSNICRLVLELRSKNSQDENPASNVKSLDGKYSFELLKHIIGERVDPY